MMEDALFEVDTRRHVDIIAMGRVAVDLYAEQIGAELFEAQTFRKYLGGCAGNIAVGCSRFGLRSSMLSCVGSDQLGQFLQRTLVEEGVLIDLLQVSKHHLTGLVMLGINPPDRFPLMFFRNDCADMAIDTRLINEQAISQAKTLLITGTGLSHKTTRDATMHIVRLAKKVGTKVILDIDYRPVLWGQTPVGDGENRYVKSAEVSEIFSLMLKDMDLIVGTEEEIRIAGGDEDFSWAIRKIRKLTKAFIVVKRGAYGSAAYLANITVPRVCDAFATQVINVLGAGDAFMAGLLYGLLRGESFSKAMIKANAAGAIVVSRHACSHASPSNKELEFFLANKNNTRIIHHPTMLSLHRRSTLKNHARRAPMPVLAFCHRWQLEEVIARNNESSEKIVQFKEAVAQALVECSNAHGIANASMLCDPLYGHAAIECGHRANLGIIVAIEKSGNRLTEWLVPESAYEILLTRPPSFGVKILWHYFEDFSDEEKHHQLRRLKELDRACAKLDRKLMLELVVQAKYQNTDQWLIDAVKTVYQAGIQPYWWKLSPLSGDAAWNTLYKVFDIYDDSARLLVLGGDAKNLNDYRSDFARLKSSTYGIGFAVGRSIFWHSFLGFVEGSLSIKQVKKQIGDNFFQLYQLWLNA